MLSQLTSARLDPAPSLSFQASLLPKQTLVWEWSPCAQRLLNRPRPAGWERPWGPTTLQALGVGVQIKPGWMKRQSGHRPCSSWPLRGFSQLIFLTLLRVWAKFTSWQQKESKKITSQWRQHNQSQSGEEENIFSPNVKWITSQNPDDLMPKLRLLTFTIGSSQNARRSLCSRLKPAGFWVEIWRISF